MQKRRAKLHSSEEDERQRRRDQGRNLYRDSLFWHVHDQLCASISCDERNIAASHWGAHIDCVYRLYSCTFPPFSFSNLNDTFAFKKCLKGRGFEFFCFSAFSGTWKKYDVNMERSDDTVEIFSVLIENLRGAIEEHDIFVTFTWKHTVMYTSIAVCLMLHDIKTMFLNCSP
jgi:hypothetical protein